MFNKIAAIVVFYHPPKEVINNILTYSKDISNVIVIDNSEEGVDKNKGYVDQLMKKNPDRSFHYHSMGENKGLAEAFNFGLELADLLGCDWCFTMDSDSSFQNDIVSVYQNAERKYADSKVIAYAPQYDYDRIILRKSNRVETTIWSMTSGTMFHIKKTIEAGGFDPWFFVDGLDVELGYRLKKLGYLILRCYGAVLNHSPAQTVKIEVFGKKIRYGVAEPIRYYYQARADMRILISYFAPYAFFDMFMRFIKIIFLFDRKTEYLRAWGRGVLDAVYNREGMQTQLLRLKYKLLKYRKVSFDIYDTLIKRDVEDKEDVFFLLAKEYIKEYGSDEKTIQDVIQLRLLAQRTAESKKVEEEISIFDIYSNSGFKQNVRTFLLAREQELEYQLAQRNLLIGRLYDWCIQCRKEVILTSDMYLPLSTINSILEKNNYTRHKRVYLSSHSGKRKSTGSLFDEVLQAEQCTGKEIIHLGDAKKGDFLRPIQKGIHSVLLSRNQNICLNKREKLCLANETNIYHRTLHQFINNRIENFTNITFRIGYELFGPMLYGYCGWLHNKSKEHNVRHIYFLAREGVFLHQAYLKMYPEYEDRCSVLRVSRHALKKALEKPEGNQMRLLKKYLVQENFIDDTEDNRAIAVADVGWQGTMQKALTSLCHESIFGFYMGFKNNNELKNTYGYLFQGDRNRAIQDEIMFTATFIENCFMVSEGTTLEYSMQDKYVVPILAECEQSNEALHVVKTVQRGMLHFMEDALSSDILKEIIKMPIVTEMEYARYMSHIKKNILKKIDTMVCKDDKGVSRITAQKRLMFYIIHPKKLAGEFKLNKSKLLFLKSICDLPIPYMKLLSVLKRLEEQRNGTN